MSEHIQRFSIARAAFNPYHAEAFGLVFKLSYVSRGKNQPSLEIFLNDAEALTREWHIYGTLLDESDDRFSKVSFAAIGERKRFQIGRDAFDVTFVDVISEPGCIARQNESTFNYNFVVEKK